MKIPLVSKEVNSKGSRLWRGNFFSRFARNRTNLFKSFKSLRYGWINYAGRPVRPTRYQPRATPWESVMCGCRPAKGKSLTKTPFFCPCEITPFPQPNALPWVMSSLPFLSTIQVGEFPKNVIFLIKFASENVIF